MQRNGPFRSLEGDVGATCQSHHGLGRVGMGRGEVSKLHGRYQIRESSICFQLHVTIGYKEEEEEEEVRETVNKISSKMLD